MRVAAFTLVVATVFFIFGYWFGQIRTDRHLAHRAEDGSAMLPPPTSCAVSIDPTILRAELARALGAAVPMLANSAETSPSPKAADQPSQEGDPGPAPTPAQVSAFERGRVLTDRVLSQGRMSVAESREIREILASMDNSSRLETTRRLIQAMNQGKLQTESHELPF